MKVFGFAAWSGSGKTTLIEQLIPRFKARGLVVSVIKHVHHDFDIDRPGKDSFRHREAGAAEVLVSSDVRWALMHELRGAAEPTLGDLVSRLSPCDLVLVEGFRRQPFPKVEVHRKAAGGEWLHPGDSSIVAVVTDEKVSPGLPVFALDDYEGLTDFILGHPGNPSWTTASPGKLGDN